MTIITESVSKILGSLIIQNNNNDKLIFVYDRDRKFSMHKGSVTIKPEKVEVYIPTM